MIIKLKPLKCLKHRKTGMVNIKRNHMLCEKHDISHSKKQVVKYVNLILIIIIILQII